jgi:hypothetical protein
MVMTFEISRVDGRSNAQVIVDFVHGAPPGRVFTFAELEDELARGASRAYGRAAVSGIVAGANRRLLREHHRRLHSVRGQGYRLAPAAEHVVLASADRHRADKQLARGLETLRNVRWEEMDENQQAAHRGQLMVLESVASAQAALDQRMDRIEQALDDLVRRGDEAA